MNAGHAAVVSTPFTDAPLPPEFNLDVVSGKLYEPGFSVTAAGDWLSTAISVCQSVWYRYY